MAKLALSRTATAGLAAGLLLASETPAAAAPQPAMPPFPNRTDEASAMLWLRQNTSLGVGQHVVFAEDHVLVVLTDEPSPERPALHRVTFRQEATRIDFVSRNGGRSLRGEGEVDCTTGAYRSELSELFVGTDLQGERVDHQGPVATGFQPPAGTALSAMVQAVCRPNSALRPLASTARTPPAASPARPSEPAPAPPPSEPGSIEARRAVSSAPLAPLPPPPPPPPPPPTPSAPAAAARPASAPAAPAPARAATPRPPAPSPAPAPAGEPVAQIGAFSSYEAAQKAWDRLTGLFPSLMSGRSMRIDSVQVNGAPMYRTAIAGFGSEEEARALCARLLASSEACFVRTSP